MPTTNAITHLDVKTYGKVKVTTANGALTRLKGTTLTVRSGAEVGNEVSIFSPKSF